MIKCRPLSFAARCSVLSGVKRESLKKSNFIQKANSHTLKIPYNHLPYVKFKDGIPERQIREIQPWEVAAGYGRIWSTSESKDILPNCTFLTYVPECEVWVMERFGKFHKALRGGWYFIVPYIDKVRALRTPYQVSNGIFASCKTIDGKKVDIYCVLHFKWTDYQVSSEFVDEERGNCDAERSLQLITLEAIVNEAKRHKFQGNGKIEPEIVSKILNKIKAIHAEYTEKYGMEVLSVEIRGAWDEAHGIPNRLYSLEPEARRPDAAGDNVSADYWGDLMAPNLFERYTYGSEKKIITPAVTTLEWAIPSPPDFHHFNMTPVILMDPQEYAEKKGKVL